MMVGFLLAAAALHPFHGSISEVQWNAETQRFEIAMRLDPRDLTLALSKQSSDPKAEFPEPPIDLERTAPERLEVAIMRLLKSKCIARDDRGRLGQLHWVGLENEPKYVWLYIELEPPQSARHVKLRNEILFDVAPTQVNTMVFGGPGKRFSLQFSRQQATHTLRQQDGQWLPPSI